VTWNDDGQGGCIAGGKHVFIGPIPAPFPVDVYSSYGEDENQCIDKVYKNQIK
jgi:hypothetical protein